MPVSWHVVTDGPALLPRTRGAQEPLRLHDTMTQWLRSRGLGQLWLTTEPGTRAQKFYESAGWRFAGTTPRGEARYELGEEV